VSAIDIRPQDALSQLWLFIVASIIGGIIAAVIWKYGFEAALDAKES
jgi:glycerol uptake facilitator-like aquaporin